MLGWSACLDLAVADALLNSGPQKIVFSLDKKSSELGYITVISDATATTQPQNRVRVKAGSQSSMDVVTEYQRRYWVNILRENFVA